MVADSFPQVKVIRYLLLYIKSLRPAIVSICDQHCSSPQNVLKLILIRGTHGTFCIDVSKQFSQTTYA